MLADYDNFCHPFFLAQIGVIVVRGGAMAVSIRKTLILCVDDEAILLRLRSLVLLSAGYEVMTATNAQDALEMFKARPFDLVITDHLLPGQSGTDMATEMKKLRPEVPILLVSGTSELPQRAESIDDHLTKGTRVELFLDRIKKLIR